MKRKIVILLCSIFLFVLFSYPAFASGRTGISSIDIDVSTDKTEITLNDIDVRTGSQEYECESKEYNPITEHVILKFRTKSGYYFSFKKASDIRISGANYVKAIKTDSSEVLTLTISMDQGKIWKEINENWVKDENGWKYLKEDGAFVETGWNEINGEHYYFDENGYIVIDAMTPDGYYVDIEGRWDGKSAQKSAKNN